jgi:hypothetical protein
MDPEPSTCALIRCCPSSHHLMPWAPYGISPSISFIYPAISSTEYWRPSHPAKASTSGERNGVEGYVCTVLYCLYSTVRRDLRDRRRAITVLDLLRPLHTGLCCTVLTVCALRPRGLYQPENNLSTKGGNTDYTPAAAV